MKTETILEAFPYAGEREARKLAATINAACTHEEIDAALGYANTLLNGYGVEALHDDSWADYYLSIGLLYVNLGDPYYTTLVYDTRDGQFRCEAWGNVVEDDPDRFADR